MYILNSNSTGWQEYVQEVEVWECIAPGDSCGAGDIFPSLDTFCKQESTVLNSFHSGSVCFCLFLLCLGVLTRQAAGHNRVRGGGHRHLHLPQQLCLPRKEVKQVPLREFMIEIHAAWEDATFFGHYCNKSESTLGEYKYIETDKEKHGVGL